MRDLFAQLIAPYARRLSNMLARGAVTLADSSTKMQLLQLRILSGEKKDGVEYFEPYGFTSTPLRGSEHLTGFIDGDRSHGVTFCVADRRYRVKNLAAGEMALYTWKDVDPAGHHIIFKNDGSIEVKAVNITIKASGTARIEGDIVKIHAVSKFQFDCNGHGQQWLPAKVNTWQIGEVPGTTNNIAPPEIP